MLLVTENGAEGEETVLKVRLSTTSKDVKLTVRSNNTIAQAKRKLDVCILHAFSLYYFSSHFDDD